MLFRLAKMVLIVSYLGVLGCDTLVYSPSDFNEEDPYGAPGSRRPLTGDSIIIPPEKKVIAEKLITAELSILKCLQKFPGFPKPRASETDTLEIRCKNGVLKCPPKEIADIQKFNECRLRACKKVSNLDDYKKDIIPCGGPPILSRDCEKALTNASN